MEEKHKVITNFLAKSANYTLPLKKLSVYPSKSINQCQDYVSTFLLVLCFDSWNWDGRNYHEQPSFCIVSYILVSIHVMKKNHIIFYEQNIWWQNYLMTEIFDSRNIWWQKFSLQSKAGDSEVNNPQKVECKLKVKAKVRETKLLPKANESKEISKVKITKVTPRGHIFKYGKCGQMFNKYDLMNCYTHSGCQVKKETEEKTEAAVTKEKPEAEVTKEKTEAKVTKEKTEAKVTKEKQKLK